MEGKWGFVNRHCDPADGEVVRLQVSRVPRVSRCAALRGGSLGTVASPHTVGRQAREPDARRLWAWNSPVRSVYVGFPLPFCLVLVSSSFKVSGVGGGWRGFSDPIIRSHYQRDCCLFFVWTHPPVGASKQIHQF